MADANDPMLFGDDFDDEFSMLLQRYLDSKLTTAELAALEERLRTAPAARSEFVRGLMQQAYLRELVAQERSAASLAEMLDEEAASVESAPTDAATPPILSPIIPPLSDQGAGPRPSHDTSFSSQARPAPVDPLPGSAFSPGNAGSGDTFAFQNWRLVGGLIGVLMLAVFAIVVWPSDDHKRSQATKLEPLAPAVAAEPIAQRNCVWLVDGKPAKPTKLMTGSTVRLEQGEAELRFGKNVRVALVGPVEFQPAAPDRIILLDGPATARVPREAIGFMVDTPTMRVVDLGTEFGVKSYPDGRAELHVFVGKVSVQLADGSGLKRIIRTGQSIGVRMKGFDQKPIFAFDDTTPVKPSTFQRIGVENSK